MNDRAFSLDEIHKAGPYDTIWQACAVLLPVPIVGGRDEGRTYDYVCALRVGSLTDMRADYMQNRDSSQKARQFCRQYKPLSKAHSQLGRLFGQMIDFPRLLLVRSIAG